MEEVKRSEANFNEDSKSDVMNLQSRAIAVYGTELMTKLRDLRVLVIGMKGVGVETAKNLVLGGIGSVTLFDNQNVAISDLNTNFYLTSADVGKKRSVCVRSKVASLNPYVDVQAHTGELNEHFCANFHAVVITSDDILNKQELIRLNHTCRRRSTKRLHAQNGEREITSSPVAFFMALNRGVTCSLFVDLGPNHVVHDTDGTPAKMYVVEHITAAGLVTLAAKHTLDDGELIRFEDVEGMSALNTIPSIPIQRVYQTDAKTKRRTLVPDQIQLDFQKAKIDPSILGNYTNGGVVVQVKQSLELSFGSLEDQFYQPELLPNLDSAKAFSDETAQLHFAHLAIWEFMQRHSRPPTLHDQDDAKVCVGLAEEILNAHKEKNYMVVEKIDENVVRNTVLFSRAELPGFTAFLGGLIAQEVIKIPGKFTPIRQMFHFAEFSLVPQGVPADAVLQKSRYDHQIAIFGNAFQQKLLRQKWFLVGAGALGCEYIKGFALMGLGCHKEGEIKITDMDTIEISNLSRQFLFRREDVGQPKSSVAAAVAAKMNADLNIKVYTTAVSPDTENVFDDDFWEGIDGVCNALDNIKARRYTCQKCVVFNKPLLESGTLGTMANNEVIIPYHTDIYNEQERNDEDNIPLCTIHNFPHLIEHCIIWARAQFTDQYQTGPQALKSFLQNRQDFFRQLPNEGNEFVQREKLEQVNSLLQMSKNMTFERCVELAVLDFVRIFDHRIQDWTNTFPKDALTKEGSLFWSGHKRFPQRIEFSVENAAHIDFILAAANLAAYVFHLPQTRDRQYIKSLASKIVLPSWKPSNSNLQTDEKAETKQPQTTDKDGEILIQLTQDLSKLDLSGSLVPKVVEFEKDQDDNFHIDYITACANLRATNYHVKLASRHQVKMTAGKIIPAIATTTALITGLNLIELYKIVMGLETKHMLNSNINLAVNQLQAWEPAPAPKTKSSDFDIALGGPLKAVPEGWNVWDKIVVNRGDLTIDEFVKVFPEIHHGCTVQYIVGSGKTNKGIMMYTAMPYGAQEVVDTYKRNQKRKMVDVYADLYGAISPKAKFILLEVSAVDQDGTDANIPLVKFMLVGDAAVASSSASSSSTTTTAVPVVAAAPTSTTTTVPMTEEKSA